MFTRWVGFLSWQVYITLDWVTLMLKLFVASGSDTCVAKALRLFFFAGRQNKPVDIPNFGLRDFRAYELIIEVTMMTPIMLAVLALAPILRALELDAIYAYLFPFPNSLWYLAVMCASDFLQDLVAHKALTKVTGRTFSNMLLEVFRRDLFPLYAWAAVLGDFSFIYIYGIRMATGVQA